MTLPEQIMAYYPQITWDDFQNGRILLQNDLDERGDYIREWNHPTLAKPTDAQLAAAKPAAAKPAASK